MRSIYDITKLGYWPSFLITIYGPAQSNLMAVRTDGSTAVFEGNSRFCSILQLIGNLDRRAQKFVPSSVFLDFI